MGQYDAQHLCGSEGRDREQEIFLLGSKLEAIGQLLILTGLLGYPPTCYRSSRSSRQEKRVACKNIVYSFSQNYRLLVRPLENKITLSCKLNCFICLNGMRGALMLQAKDLRFNLNSHCTKERGELTLCRSLRSTLHFKLTF